ncbi:hypothetical protein L0F63_000492 [Massospora cicadina]|nr:hypothetical protein L0F63_000492 [Massospora cicadina]
MRQAQDPQLLKELNNQDLSEIKDSSKPSSDPPKESSLSKKDKKADSAGLSARKKKRQSLPVASPDELRSKRANLESSSQNGSENAEKSKASRSSESGACPSSGGNDLSPADASKCRTISPLPSADLQEEIGIDGNEFLTVWADFGTTELKTIRQSLQKATLKDGYDDVELVDQYLSKLENTQVTAALIRNDYDFKGRFRALLTRYKQFTVEAQEAEKSSPHNGEARAVLEENDQTASNPDRLLNLSKTSFNQDADDASDLQSKEEPVEEAPIPSSNGAKEHSPAVEQGLPRVYAEDSSSLIAEGILPE